MEAASEQNPIIRRQGPLFSRFLDAMFAALLFYFPSRTKVSAKALQEVVPVIFAALDICQMASLLFLPTTASGFPYFIKQITNFIRLDGLAEESGLLLPFVLTHMSLIVGIYVCLIIKAMFGNIVGASIKSAWMVVVNYLQYISFLPSLLSFEIYCRYWLVEQQDVYSQPLQFVGVLGPMSLVFVPLLLGAVLLPVFFDYSLLYDPRALHFNSRSQSFELLCHYVARFFLVTLFVVLGSSERTWNRLPFLAVGSATTAIVLRGLPFYTTANNAALLWASMTLTWSAVVVVLSGTLKSDLVAAVLFVVISPLLFALAYCEVLRRMSPAYETSSHEVLFRRELCKAVETGKTDEKRLDGLLGQMRMSAKDAARMCLLEASFFLHYLNNREAAQQSFVKFLWKKPSLESRFQQYRLAKESESVEQVERELQYLQMMVTTLRVQEADADICYKLTLFLQEMSSRYCQLGRLEKLATSLTDSSKVLLTECRVNLHKFPRSSRLLYLYGSFLEEVLNDSTGRSYKERSRSIMESSMKGTGDAAHSFESCAVFCVSISRNSLGSVHFLNDKAVQMFGVDKSEELRIEQLLPPELASLHTDLLEKVVLTGLPLGHLVRLYSCLQTSKECKGLVKMHVKLLLWRELPYLFVHAQPDTERKAFVLFNELCMVIYHTENLGTLLLGHPKDYENCYLFDEFPTLPKELLELPSGSSVQLYADSSLVTLFEHVPIGSKVFYLISVLAPENESPAVRRVVVRYNNHIARDKIVHFNHDFDVTTSLNVPIEAPEEEKEFDGKLMFSDSQLKLTSTGAITSGFSLASGNSLSSSHESMHLSSVYAREARSASKRLRVLVLLSILLVIGLFLGTGVFLVDILRRLQEADIIEEMSRRRHLGIDMADKVRRLQLIERGWDTASREEILESLHYDISNYTFSLNLIKRKVDDWDNTENREVYFKAKIPIFELREGQVFTSMADLFEASYHLLTHVGAVASAPSIADCSESVYYVLRNSPAETLHLVNRTMFLFVQDETSMRDQNFSIVEGLFYGVMSTIVICTLLLVLPQIVLLERCNQLVWKAIFATPFESKVETRHRIVDRMQFLHNIELPAAETTRQDKDVAPRQAPRIWPALALKLAALCIFSTVILAVVVFVIYSHLKDELRTIPNYLNWAGVRAFETYEINYWLKEMHLQDFPVHQLAPNFHIPAADTHLNHSLASVRFIKKLMASRDPRYGLYLAQDSEGYKNYRYQSACQQGNDLLNCESKVENYGLYYAIAEYVQLAAHMRADSKNLTWTDFVRFEEAKADLFYTSKKGSSVYSSEAQVLVANEEVKLVATVSVYTVLALLTYCCYYAHQLKAVGEKLADKASLLRMISGK